MKAFLWIVLLGIIGLAGYFLIASMVPDEGRMISFALGNVEDDTIEIHVVLSTLMSQSDTMAYTGEHGMDRAAWAKDHYLVTDGTGTHVELKRKMSSGMINDSDTRGYHDSFLVGRLKVGTEYTFTYLPEVGGKEKYRYTFTAPATDEGRRTASFDRVP